MLVRTVAPDWYRHGAASRGGGVQLCSLLCAVAQTILLDSLFQPSIDAADKTDGALEIPPVCGEIRCALVQCSVFALQCSCGALCSPRQRVSPGVIGLSTPACSNFQDAS